MTQTQKNALKVVIPFISTIFLAGIAWRDVRGDVKDKLPAVRFMLDSARRDGVTAVILSNQAETNNQLRELNARMLDVCIALKGRAGCK